MGLEIDYEYKLFDVLIRLVNFLISITLFPRKSHKF